MRLDLADLEARRLQEQSRLDSLKGPIARNAWGQFATPPLLAQEIASYVRDLWTTRTDRIRFLDPAIGTGAFYSALLRVAPPNSIQSAHGIELDSGFSTIAHTLWHKTGLEVIQNDFTRTSPNALAIRPNLIIANPPYVRHHHLDPDEKVRLKQIISKRFGYTLSGLAGLYCYFLLLADAWLADNGIGLWLLPSEFMDVNYGTIVKRYLTENVELLHVHHFDPLERQFGDALVSSAIVVFKKAKPPGNHRVLFSSGGSLPKPRAQCRILLSQVADTPKWTKIKKLPSITEDATKRQTISLGDLFSIKRGIATGANNFFVLPRERAISLGIPEKFLKPILPSPRYLKTSIIKADADGYPNIDKPLALLDCDVSEEKLCKAYPQLWSYLKSGDCNGVRESYLTRKRFPWYKQEQRPPAPFLCTYMGREAKNRSPFRFLWNQSNATAANVYLLLYPLDPLKEILSEKPHLARQVFEHLQAIRLSDLKKESRVYGGGLHKLEPAELARVSVKNLVETLGLKIVPNASQPILPFAG